jgi:hypothetical protein
VRGSSPQIPVVEIYSAQAEQLQILPFERFVTMMIDLIGDVAITLRNCDGLTVNAA